MEVDVQRVCAMAGLCRYVSHFAWFLCINDCSDSQPLPKTIQTTFLILFNLLVCLVCACVVFSCFLYMFSVQFFFLYAIVTYIIDTTPTRDWKLVFMTPLSAPPLTPFYMK